MSTNDTKNTITFPTIHLNGTGRTTLSEGCEEMTEALRATLDAFQKHGPNGRDYYHQGDAAFGKARDEHVARIAALKKILVEIEAIHEHIVDA